ncbi:MAG: LETM1 domain-containing protein [Myxococcaceae bacterium]
MEFAKPGWLLRLLDDVVARQTRAPAPEAPTLSRPTAHARAYLHRALRDSGLVYGTPELPEDAPPDISPAQTLFLAVLRTLARFALDAALLFDAPEGPRAVQLARMFALWTGELRLADAFGAHLANGTAVSRWQWSRLEAALARRSLSISGDRVYGLLLHNGATYVDAQLFAHLVLDVWSGRRLERASLRRLLGVAARQKALLVEVLTALASAERPPSSVARRAILRQVEDLGLPRRLAGQLRGRLRQAFDGPLDLPALVAPVRSREMRRFIVEQTVLASLVEGRRSAKEVAFIGSLAADLGFSPQVLLEVEAEVAKFYAHHRAVVDIFTVQGNAALLGDELVGSMQTTLDRSLQVLLAEAHQMGELSSLLARLARGQTLSALERRRMREQLLDLAKAIPAVAIFAAPGGVLLLAALVKLLPQSFLPSVFQEPSARASDGSRAG